MDVFTVQYQLAAVAAAIVILRLFVWLTNAESRRFFAAVVAGLAGAALNFGFDVAASAVGWWWYPGGDSSVTLLTAPVVFYVAQDLVVCGALGLAGWRVQGRFGRRGLAAFIFALACLGLCRDLALSTSSPVMVFGPGALPWIVDFIAWTSIIGSSPFVMERVMGKARD